MRRSKNFKTLARALGVVSAVVIIVGGVTFAALQSQQNTLVGSRIETATASLGIGSDGSNFGTALSGFDFNNLVPGGPAVPTTGYPFYLKNSGGTPLGLKLVVTSVPTNPNNVDFSKVNVLLTTVGGASGTQSFSLQSLITASAGAGVDVSGSLASGITQQYKLQVSMATDAVTGSNATIGNIDLTFSGVALAN